MNPFNVGPHSISVSLAIALFHLFGLGIGVGAAALLGNHILRRARAASRYLLDLALLAVMLVGVPCLVGRQFGAANRPEMTSRANQAASTNGPSGIDPPTIAGGTRKTAEQVPFHGPVLAAERSGNTEFQYARRESVQDVVAPWIVSGYCVGLLVMLGRMLAALYGGHRLRRASCRVVEPGLLDVLNQQARAIGLRMAPAVAYCQHVAVPVVVGVLRPVILFPMSMACALTPQQLRDVLTHELAHIRRLDHLVVVFQRLAEALWFFHPTVWYLSWRLSCEREHCCDDLVIAAGSQRISYAQTLCRVAELGAAARSEERRPVVLAADGRHPSQLRRRIIRVLETPPELGVRLTRSGVLGLVALVTLVFVPPLLAPTLNHRLQAAIASEEPQNVEPKPSRSSVAPTPSPERKQVSKTAHQKTDDDALRMGAAAPTPLKDAVAKFNQEKSQPWRIANELSRLEAGGYLRGPTLGKDRYPGPLTEEEVIGAIHAWEQKRENAGRPSSPIFKQIAKSRTLPPRAWLDLYSYWRPAPNREPPAAAQKTESVPSLEYLHWSIRLFVMTGERTGEAIVIRDQDLDVARLALPADPGYEWAIAPFPVERLPYSVFTSKIIVFVEKGLDQGLSVTASFGTRNLLPGNFGRGSDDVRGVAFEKEGKRFVLKPGVAGATPDVVMQRFRLHPDELPADRVHFVGVEILSERYRKPNSQR